MTVISSKWLGGAILGAMWATILVVPASSAETKDAIPDFSGMWWRNAMDPELPASGPKPLVNLRRPYNDLTPNGGGDPAPPSVP